jgi:hypothetical protein
MSQPQRMASPTHVLKSCIAMSGEAAAGEDTRAPLGNSPPPPIPYIRRPFGLFPSPNPLFPSGNTKVTCPDSQVVWGPAFVPCRHPKPHKRHPQVGILLWYVAPGNTKVASGDTNFPLRLTNFTSGNTNLPPRLTNFPS